MKDIELRRARARNQWLKRHGAYQEVRRGDLYFYANGQVVGWKRL